MNENGFYGLTQVHMYSLWFRVHSNTGKYMKSCENRQISRFGVDFHDFEENLAFSGSVP